MRMKETIHLKKGERIIINLFSLILMDGKNLYLDPSEEVTKKALIHIPDGIKCGDTSTYFHSCYLVPNENFTLHKNDIIFSIRGMFPRINRHDLSADKPVCVEDDGEYNKIIQCNHQTYLGQTASRYLVIPKSCENDFTEKLYEKLKGHFQYNSIASYLAQWSLASHAEGSLQENEPDLGTPSENQNQEKTGKAQKSPPPEMTPILCECQMTPQKSRLRERQTNRHKPIIMRIMLDRKII